MQIDVTFKQHTEPADTDTVKFMFIVPTAMYQYDMYVKVAYDHFDNKRRYNDRRAYILGVANCVVRRDDDVLKIRNEKVVTDEQFSVFTVSFFDSQQSTGEDRPCELQRLTVFDGDKSSMKSFAIHLEQSHTAVDMGRSKNIDVFCEISHDRYAIYESAILKNIKDDLQVIEVWFSYSLGRKSHSLSYYEK